MCWPHVHRNVEKKITTLKVTSENPKLGTDVMDDIEILQWTSTKKNFESDYNAMEDKYLKGSYNVKETQALKEFFSYFRLQWGPGSPVGNWFEHSHPYHVSHNMGLEGLNKDIKRNHTFKSRVGLGKLFSILGRMLKEWSSVDDTLLNSHRFFPSHFLCHISCFPSQFPHI
jgi:hypothetical protein